MADCLTCPSLVKLAKPSYRHSIRALISLYIQSIHHRSFTCNESINAFILLSLPCFVPFLIHSSFPTNIPRIKLSSHRLKVLVITISLIFKSSSTQNLVCPCTFNGELSGDIPREVPENVPVSYQWACTHLLVRPLPHVGP